MAPVKFFWLFQYSFCIVCGICMVTSCVTLDYMQSVSLQIWFCTIVIWFTFALLSADSPYHDVSGLPDPYMDQLDCDDSKPQHISLSFDESLESGYSTPNSRSRRVIREIIVWTYGSCGISSLTKTHLPGYRKIEAMLKKENHKSSL